MAESPTPARVLVSSANTGTTIITAGGSGWTLVRDLTLCNETNGPVTVSLGMGTTNTDAVGKRQEKSLTLQPGDPSYKWAGVWVLAGGGSPDLLYVVCDTANGVTVTLGAVTGP